MKLEKEDPLKWRGQKNLNTAWNLFLKDLYHLADYKVYDFKEKRN